MKKRNLLLVAFAMYLCPLLLLGCFDSTTDVVDDKPDIVDDGGDDFLDSIKGDTINETKIDFLFDQMIEQLESYENFNGIDDLDMENFNDIATSFAGFIKADSSHVKANVGYAVSRIAMLNSNKALKELADSLDRYFTDWDNYDNGGELQDGIFSRSLRRNGIDGLGLALFSQSSKIIRSNSTIPSFPQYITISKIQDLIESEIMPALNGAIGALENIENTGDGSLKISVEGESYELDLGEIYLADAGLRLTRHSLSLLTTYNFDLQTPDGSPLYKIVDDYVAIEENDTSGSTFLDIVTLSADGDTLLLCSGDSSKYLEDVYGYTYDLVVHNLQRSDFLTIKRENHARMYADIKAVPEKIIAAINYIEAEQDNQEDDLLKIATIGDLDAEMIDFADGMKGEGFSSEFITHFKSPQYLALFISDILQNKYTLNETINGVDFAYEIDLAKFYTNPVKDLRDWLPLYSFNGKANCIQKNISADYAYPSMYSSYTVDENSGTVADFDMSLIESVTDVSDGVKNYTFKKSSSYYGYGSIRWDFVPVALVDPAGNKLVSEIDDLEDALFDETLFPHFKDYTFNGIFPDMTRARWIKLVQDIDGL